MTTPRSVTTTRNAKLALGAVLAMAAVLVVLRVQTTRAQAAPPQQNSGSGFLGAWCAQGDPTKQCSISSNGVFLTFTNESGSTATGQLAGTSQNRVTADDWNFVQGTLSSDGSRIDWSNGTFWARCSSGGGGGRRTPNVDGTWYRSGNRSQACYIRQRRQSLQLSNESGQKGSGSLDRRGHLTTNWSGTQVSGTLSKDGNTIYWNNGTSWTR